MEKAYVHKFRNVYEIEQFLERHNQPKRQKSHNYINICSKNIWRNLIPIKNMNSCQTRNTGELPLPDGQYLHKSYN